VNEKLMAFKENIPIIENLCNPGLRDRHWEQVPAMTCHHLISSHAISPPHLTPCLTPPRTDQMAEVVGYNIKPDEFTTLSRVADQQLQVAAP
jgi:hypothetical protein